MSAIRPFQNLQIPDNDKCAQNINKRVGVKPNHIIKTRVAERYEMIVISANTAMAKNGPKKIKELMNGDKVLEGLIRTKNTLLWNNLNLEGLGSVGHSVYKERLLIDAKYREWHEDFAFAYYAYFEDYGGQLKKKALEKVLLERKEELEKDMIAGPRVEDYKKNMEGHIKTIKTGISLKL